MKTVLSPRSLRDPVWQAVGTIIGLLAILISTVVAYDIFRRSTQTSELTISELVHFDPLQFGETMKGRVALLIDGVSVESVVVYYYSLTNSGSNPIRPNDFVQPIQVSAVAPWKLLAVDTHSSIPSDLQTQWTRVVTDTFQLDPTLLNPQDTINVLLFLTNPDKDEGSVVLDWSARIVNIQSLKIQEPVSLAVQSGLGAFFVGITHSGWSVYWLAGIAILLFLVALWLARRSGRLYRFSLKQAIYLTIIMTLSFSSAEIIVTALDGRREQWWGAWLLVGLHLLLLLYLLWPSLRALAYRKHIKPIDSEAQAEQ